MNNFLILVLALLFTSTVAFKLRNGSVGSPHLKSKITAMSGDELTSRLQGFGLLYARKHANSNETATR